MKFADLKTVTDLVGARRYRAAANKIDRLLAVEPGANWQRDLGKLAHFLRSPRRRKAPFTILAQGNGKLPFLAFSALPGVTCPGAGECLDFCYSFRAWRYPASFARQVQNTVLLWEQPHAITAAFAKHEKRGKQAFRLYVDGDFDSLETVNFWWGLLRANPWLDSYGYSKSLKLLLRAPQAPDNYRLNLSSGHKYNAQTIARAERLPYTRGHFVAVDLGHKVKSTDHGKRSHQRKLRQAYQASAFTCPGKCGDCTPTGHACGSPRFDNVDIIIAAH